MSTETSKYNLLTTCRWLALIPVKPIDPNQSIKEMSFNLTSFDLNPISLGSNPVAGLGYSIEFPNYVRDHDKTITFNYKLDSALSQYRFLYKWTELIASEDGAGLSEDIDSTNKTEFSQFAFPVRLLLLSEFLNPVLEVTFEDSWISQLGGISFNYQDSGASTITHSFTIKYSRFVLDDDPNY